MSGMEKLELFEECNLVVEISMHILKMLKILKNKFQELRVCTTLYNLCTSKVFFSFGF